MKCLCELSANLLRSAAYDTTYNTTVKIFLGRSHLDCNSKALKDFGATQADKMKTHNPLVVTLANNLVCCGLLLLRIHHRKVHGRKFGLVNLDAVSVLRPGGLFAEADRP